MKHAYRLLLATLVLSALSSPVFAQWVQTGERFDGYVYCFAVDGTNLFAATDPGSGGVSLTTNNGASWTQVNTGLPFFTTVKALATSGSNLVAGTDGSGVFLSTDSGTTWNAVASTISYVYALAASDSRLFAGGSKINGSGCVFFSTNNGTSWTQVNTGLPDTSVYALAVSGTNLFAGTYNGGVFLSTNNGTSWAGVNAGLVVPYITALAVSDSNIFAGTDGGGVFRSTNNGTSWTASNTGMTNNYVYALASRGSNIFVGTAGGVFLSTNNGTSWNEDNKGFVGLDGTSFAISDTNIFLGTNGGGVWRRSLSEMSTSGVLLSDHQPSGLSLEQNYPNPFDPSRTPSTTIAFRIPSRSFVSLRVFDALGREVSVLASEELSAGTYERRWYAVSQPSGVYYYRLQADSFSESKEIHLHR